MRIAYVGTGANGAAIAADMTRAGLDVTFIEQWPEHVEAIRRDGIRVALPGGEETTPVQVRHVSEVAELRVEFDVAFLGVKAYDTRWSTELIATVMHRDGVVVGMQNGMTRDAITSIVGRRRSLGAVIEVTANMFEPGVVVRESSREASWFALEDSPGVDAQRVADIASALRSAGTVDLTRDIHSAKWMKLVVNAAELVPSALVGLPLLQAVRDPELHDFMLATGREAVHAAAADGGELVPILGMPSDVDVSDATEFADALFAQVLSSFSMPNTETTSLQDWRKGRRSEVRELNGHVAAVARAHGVPAPLNDFTLRVALEVERGERGFSMTNREDMVARLRQGEGPSDITAR